MTLYRCRTTKPSTSDWHEIEEGSPEDAAQEFHSRCSPPHPLIRGIPNVHYKHYPTPDSRIDHYFVCVEVEGHGEVVSKMLFSCIWRKGGVNRHPTTIQDVARQLGWTRNPQELLEAWEGEDPG